jgi:hypothetical protein
MKQMTYRSWLWMAAYCVLAICPVVAFLVCCLSVQAQTHWNATCFGRAFIDQGCGSPPGCPLQGDKQVCVHEALPSGMTLGLCCDGWEGGCHTGSWRGDTRSRNGTSCGALSAKGMDDCVTNSAYCGCNPTVGAPWYDDYCSSYFCFNDANTSE